jgi:WD40 repeat protein
MYVYSNDVGDPSEWLLQRYRLIATLSGHKGPVNCFAFNNDSSLLASGGELPFNLYDN